MPLADFHAIVAQDVVRRGGVKIKVRHRAFQQQIDAGELHLAVTLFDGDALALGAVHLCRLDALKPRHRVVRARGKLGETLFVHIHLGRFHAGKQRDAVTRVIGGRLHLARQGEHVGIQPVVQQRGFIEFLFSVQRLRLFQHNRKAFDVADKHGQGNLGHGYGHGGSPWG